MFMTYVIATSCNGLHFAVNFVECMISFILVIILPHIPYPINYSCITLVLLLYYSRIYYCIYYCIDYYLY